MFRGVRKGSAKLGIRLHEHCVVFCNTDVVNGRLRGRGGVE